MHFHDKSNVKQNFDIRPEGHTEKARTFSTCAIVMYLMKNKLITNEEY